MALSPRKHRTGNLGRQKESIRTAREAVRLNPQEWRTFTRLAIALSKSKGQADEGLVAAQHAVALAPNEGGTHLAAGSRWNIFLTAGTAQARGLASSRPPYPKPAACPAALSFRNCA